MEDAGDVGGGGDDVDDAHPAAALATEGHIDGEDAGEEIGPPEAAGSRRRLGGVVGAVVHGASEAERELLPGRRDGRRWNDASTEMMAICEHAEVSLHVNMRRRDKGAEAGEELVRRHVGVGGTAAPGRLEVDAHATVGECLDRVVGEGRAQ